MKNKIELTDFQEFYEGQETVYERSTYENKTISITLKGTIIVRQGSKIVYQGTQPYQAVESYNEIIEKYVDPNKNFVL